MLDRFERKFCKSDGCWLWTGCVHGKGYGHFKIGKKVEKAHRVSWMLYRGNIPQGYHVLHICDTPPCVNPDHLYLGTNADNVKDRVQKNRSACLYKNGRLKYTTDKIMEMKQQLNNGETTASVSRQFGIDNGYLSRIRRGLVRHYG